MADLESIKERSQTLISGADDLEALETLRVELLGKKGELTGLLKSLGSLPPAERPVQGEKINQAKKELSDALNDKKASIEYKRNINGFDISFDTAYDLFAENSGYEINLKISNIF